MTLLMEGKKINRALNFVLMLRKPSFLHFSISEQQLDFCRERDSVFLASFIVIAPDGKEGESASMALQKKKEA